MLALRPYRGAASAVSVFLKEIEMKRLLKSVLLILASCSVVAAQNETGTFKLEGQVVCCQDCWAKADRTIVAYGAGAE
jgi:hypothetical protein